MLSKITMISDHSMSSYFDKSSALKKSEASQAGENFAFFRDKTNFIGVFVISYFRLKEIVISTTHRFINL